MIPNENSLVSMAHRLKIATQEKEDAELTIAGCQSYLKEHCWHPPQHQRTTYGLEQFFSEKLMTTCELVHTTCQLCGYREVAEEPVPTWAIKCPTNRGEAAL